MSRGNALHPDGASRLAAFAGAALDAALAAVDVPAFIVRASGEIVRSNAAGRAAVRLVPGMAEAVARALRQSSPAESPGMDVIRLEDDEHSLVIDRRERREPRIRAAVLRERHLLTARQSEVLVVLAGGAGNRAISRKLRCAISTVELHVGALLERTGCESRAALVAYFWAGP